MIELLRLPGSRENRWAHLRAGQPVIEQATAPAKPNADVSMGEVAALKANVTRLEAEVGTLKATVARICAELGLPPQ